MNLQRYMNPPALPKPSMEGLGDLIGSIKQAIRRSMAEKKPDAEKRKNLTRYNGELEKVVADVKATYCKASWVADRGIVQNDVTAAGVIDPLAVEKGLPQDISRGVLGHVTAVSRFFDTLKGPYTTYAQKTRKVAEAMVKIADPDQAIDWAIQQLEGITMPGDAIKVTTAGLLGNPEYREDKQDNPVSRDITFPGVGGSVASIRPLTAEEIPHVADLLITVLHAWEDLSKKDAALPSFYDGEDDHEIFDSHAEGEDLWQRMVGNPVLMHAYWHSDRHENFQYLWWGMQGSLLDIATALEKWMHRSVK